MIYESGHEAIYCSSEKDGNDRYTRRNLDGVFSVPIHRFVLGESYKVSSESLLPPGGGDKDRRPYLVSAGTTLCLVYIGDEFTPNRFSASENLSRVSVAIDMFWWVVERQSKTQ